MRNRKDYQNYPANFLRALHLSELLATDIDYENLTEDQVKGADYLIRLPLLTDREGIVLHRYYNSAMTAKDIAERCNLGQINEDRVRQITKKALKKLQIKELLLYAAEGFDSHRRRMEELLEAEETAFCAARGITDRTHIYYQGLEGLNLPANIDRMMSRANVQTVRDLLMVICSGRRVRGFGALSEAAVREILTRKNLLPENFKRPAWPPVPQLDLEAMIFRELNSYGNESERKECD